MCHKADALQRALNSRKAKMGTKKNWPLWLPTYEGAINEKDWFWCMVLPQECYALFLKSVSIRLWFKYANAIKILKNHQDYIRPSRGLGTLSKKNWHGTTFCHKSVHNGAFLLEKWQTLSLLWVDFLANFFLKS